MSNKEFVIPFVGLKLGFHEFEFEIDNTFFEGIEYSLVQKGDLCVKLTLEKKETMLVGNYVLHGVVETACARCTEPMKDDIDGQFQLVYKFDDQPSDDEALVIVYPEEFEIDVKVNILEFISVSLPSRSVHTDGDCNEEMIDILSEYQVFSKAELEDSDTTVFEKDFADEDEINYDDDSGDEMIDPRWEALKNLKKK